MTMCAYNYTGMNSDCGLDYPILRCSFVDRYKRLQFPIASHLAQSVGPGASLVDLGEGAKRDAPLFTSHCAERKKEWRPLWTAILF